MEDALARPREPRRPRAPRKLRQYTAGQTRSARGVPSVLSFCAVAWPALAEKTFFTREHRFSSRVTRFLDNLRPFLPVAPRVRSSCHRRPRHRRCRSWSSVGVRHPANSRAKEALSRGRCTRARMRACAATCYEARTSVRPPRVTSY